MMHTTVFSKAIPISVVEEIDRFIHVLPDYTIFQSPAFFHFYLSVPHYTPYFIIARDKNGQIGGVILAVIITEGNLLLSYVSARCVVYGGPLVKHEKETVDALLSALNKTVGSRSLFTQFRNFREWSDEFKAVFEKHGFLYRERLNLLVQTDSKQTVLMQMSASRRRQIRKGIEAGVRICPAESVGEVIKLFNILSVLYRVKVRKPLPDKAFFIRFYELLVPQKLGIIQLVLWGDNIIGGVICPVSPGTTLSELYVCGLDDDYPQCYPSVMATWAALSYASENKIPVFDFMGLGKPEVKYGVRDFKLRFGGQVVNYGRFARRNHKVLYMIAEVGYNVLRRLRRV